MVEPTCNVYTCEVRLKPRGNNPEVDGSVVFSTKTACLRHWLTEDPLGSLDTHGYNDLFGYKHPVQTIGK